MKARDIITDALEWLNRLSPGETLNDDTAALMLRRLNTLVDEWSANAQFLSTTLVTSTNQTGNITLGVGAWAEVPPGAQIVSMSANGYPLIEMPTAAYITLAESTTAGAPGTYTYDGLSGIQLYPVPSGQIIRLETRFGVSAFADLDTEYAAAPGYKAALGISLAVRAAPTLLGAVPAPLVRAETRARGAIQKPSPAIVDSTGFRRGSNYGNGLLNGGGGSSGYDVINGNTP